MNRKKTNLKNIFIGLSTISFFSLPMIMVSCSNSSSSSNNNQELIDEQFKAFNNSIVNSRVQNNLYFENFNFGSKDEIILDINEINDYISLSSLNKAFNYSFVVNKDEPNKTIKITMKVRSGTTEFLPSNPTLQTKIIENVKSLTQDEKNQVSAKYNDWKTNGKNSVVIKNSRSEIINVSDYSKLLPSYIFSTNCTFEYGPNFSSSTGDYKITNSYKDQYGQIYVKFDVLNKITNLKFYDPSSTVDDSKITIDGFAKFADRNKETTDIYLALSKTFDLNILAPEKKLFPFIASGITTFEQVKNLIDTLVSDSNPNSSSSIENIKKIQELLNKSLTPDSWFNFEITTSANDNIGTLTVNWKIIDKITGFEVYAQNYQRSTTFNNMITLVLKNDQNEEDKKLINDGYQAYKIMSKLQLEVNKYVKKPIDFKADKNTSTDWTNWIWTDTNFRDFIKSETGVEPTKGNDEYIMFSLNATDFRFKIDRMENTKLKSNDSLGTLSIPLVLEIKINGTFINGNTSEYIKFLPPNGKTNEGNFNIALREAYTTIGQFLTTNIDDASLVYSYLTNNSEIIVNQKSHMFDNVLEKARYDESQIPTLLEEEIKKSIITQASLANPANQNKIETIINSFKLLFDFEKKPITVTNNNEITTSSVKLKIISVPNSIDESVEIKYIENGQVKEFPLVSIKIIKN